MIKTPIKLQDLRRKIYQQAKTAPNHRFWGLYVHVFKESTMTEAYRLVRASAGAAGIDGMTFEDIEKGEGKEVFLRNIARSLQRGDYSPSRNRVVEIPKGDGKSVRKLNIPTIIDRVVQTALKLIIEPIFESDFQEGSYGYRPGKKAGDAIQRVTKGLLSGKTRIIDLDLRAYFDTVKHHILIEKIAKRVQDDQILRQIKMMLKSTGKQGVPQGGSLTPRTHPQTLSFQDVLPSKEVGFDCFIKSSIFMINGKIAESGISTPDQSCLYAIEEGDASCTDYGKVISKICYIKSAGISLFATGKGNRNACAYSGIIRGFYSQTSSRPYLPNQEVCKRQGNVYQQNGRNGTGRFFSKQPEWDKKRSKLNYHSFMIDCGSKNSLRLTIFLSQLMN